VAITGWTKDPSRSWLLKTKLPSALRGAAVNQLWVSGQRRGAARTPTFRFNNTLPTGLQAKPGQLTSVANVATLRAVTYQHWTAAIRKVSHLDASTGVIGFTKPPATYTGDLPSGSRVYLENAPEYLFNGSGTFFADDDVIFYAPLIAELPQFSSRNGVEVLAATPGLLELVHNNHTSDIHLENLVFSHTDVDYESCFAGNCALQSATWLDNAAVHFEFSTNLVMRNISIEHTGGFGLWLGAGVHNASFEYGRVLDVGAGGVRIGEAASQDSDERKAMNVLVSDSVIRDGGHIYRSGCGILMQAVANATVTHNDISVFRYTGVSAGWDWSYGPTADGNNTISHNNISTIGMGELSDLGCVYHLGQVGQTHTRQTDSQEGPLSA
jgi:hypothetical protein